MKIEKISPQIAALYLGQKCDAVWITGSFSGHEVNTKNGGITPTLIDLMTPGQISSQLQITPHLRRLESMTEEEAREVYEVFYGIKFSPTKWSALEWFSKSIEPASATILKDLIGAPAVWLYLISKGFDLFELIDAGLANEITIQTT